VKDGTRWWLKARLKFDVDTFVLIDKVPKDTEKQGCYEDAIHLYDLTKACILYCGN